MPSHFELQRDRVLRDVFRAYEGPNFSLRFPDQSEWTRTPGEPPNFTLAIATAAALRGLIDTPDEIALGEAFVRGDLDVEGDFFRVFDMAEYLLKRPRSVWRRAMASIAQASFAMTRTVRHGQRHSPRRDKHSIQFHYDQPVDFFQPWLGESLVYSCAYFRSPQDTLDRAQRQKLDLICRKLQLQPGDKFLDIGCGWGSLILHAAERYGAQAHGITLSGMQQEIAQERIAAAGLEDRCRAELRDYRDCEALAGSFDKMASVGMCEHVGLENLPTYFRIAKMLLKPGGTFLNHGIARASTCLPRKDSFVERHVFPDGRLVALTDVVRCAEAAGFEVRDAENLREHYELTLRRWVEGIRQNEEEVKRHVSVETYRTWLLYMAGCAAAFRRGDLAVYQLVLLNPARSRSGLPLTREDWYREDAEGAGELDDSRSCVGREA